MARQSTTLLTPNDRVLAYASSAFVLVSNSHRQGQEAQAKQKPRLDDK